MARFASRRQGGREEQMAILDQQWSHESRLAERLSRSGQRVRDGSLALSLHPDEPSGHGRIECQEGNLVEVYNDNGSTQAIVYPTASAKRKQTFMLFAYPTGVQGNVVSPGVNEFIIPNYKQTWAGIRKIADTPEGVRHLSFKSQEYSAG